MALIDEMLVLHRTGMSTRQIAEALGVTKNTVVGRLWRAKKTLPKPVRPVPIAEPVPEPFIGSLADAFSRLTSATCRWPIGDPSKPNFRFCCAPRLDVSAYCDAHDQRAYQKSGVRK